MTPYNLKEFAEQLRLEGNDFGNEILDLLDLEEEVAEPYGTLCDDLRHYAPDDLKEKPEKALEWLGDRSHLLAEIEEQLREAGHDGDVDDVIKEIIGTLDQAEDILEAAGGPGDGDFIESLHGLAERAARAPEETEVMTYDL